MGSGKTIFSDRGIHNGTSSVTTVSDRLITATMHCEQTATGIGSIGFQRQQNPAASPFVVTTAGNVGIGTTTDRRQGWR